MQLSDSLQLAAAWFRVLDREQQMRVERDLTVQQVVAGSIIERKGELAQAWIGVLAGLVKVSVGNAEGKVASLTGVPAGGWIGEGSLLKREVRKYDIVALRDSVVARLPGATFDWLLDTSIPFNRYLLHQLNERVAQFIGKAEYDRLLDPDARVARCLAELFNPLLYPGMGMRLTITQEEVGYLARVSRQRANQALRKLEEAGLLNVEYGAVRVLDLEGLKHYGSDRGAAEGEPAAG
ncbi:Crp/Fnr family transcriptional regulator [Achromobacter denitrificans]|jgi:CRP/FNR family cyclic AMP-dependent transcriptional regulator|uniref:Crp/Fnr family transcriptional regulator n=1 Tax=Achromobacter denitrificans TaxID=32002 RepID=A0A427WXZ6_ACHDE|nr:MULTISPECIES: Crp/Fnr family transcriptional regulator [Achromobacter]ASC64964.1 Crp/Fnr family transcriptional regulator [Achromobacter denitrificans]MBV2160178.1 Crp/Fnr family transcriptional regulator [Achromobacter denitrificans]MDF3850715.1 Crp/Fnr family transcriptional regulator [Achromobacter denitrificans]MDF3860540.1 Crp/Fnr family transcriptional regulator [Achromobacter denitrificans]MDF3939427.1 Crp/Fnr family transcriptional regulator [Achromobacter denitrificans]